MELIMKRKTVIILSIIAAVVLSIGVCSYSCIRYFENSVKKMKIVSEDLRTGEKKQLTSEGINVLPRFSQDGNYIYYLSNPEKGNNKLKQKLNMLSLRDGTTSVIAEEDNGMIMTSSISQDRKLLCYIMNNGRKDICLLSLKDKSVKQLTNGSTDKTDAVFSPDGKWISYISKNDIDSRKNVWIISVSGDIKKMISNSDGMLKDVSVHTWTKDSRCIAYISFLSLIIRPIDGSPFEKIDLTGLNNFKNLLHDPADPDRFILCARESDGDMSFLFFTVSRKERSIKIWKTDRKFWEFSYDISPDGKAIVYSTKVE